MTRTGPGAAVGTLARRVRRGTRGLLFGRWPRVGLALRTALAAALAWQIALWLPLTPADTYPYYAPLGAVVGSYPTVRGSVRTSVLAVAGIVAGAVVALLVEAVLDPGPLIVPAVVFCATLLAGWRLFGDQRSWVLTASLFVLIVGAGDPFDYVLAYGGLTLLGGLVAVGVNALLPDVPLAQSSAALRRLADAVADQLDDLADGLRRDEPPSAEEWRDRLRTISPVRESARASREETEESLRGNVRAHRHLDAVRRQHVAAVVLGNLATRVEELTALLVEVQSPAERAVAMESVLRLPTAQALTALGHLARAYPDEGVPDGAGVRADVRRLSAAVSGARYSNARDQQTAGAVVTLVRRCLGALQVEEGGGDPEAVLPTPWARPEDAVPRLRRHRRFPRPWRRRPGR